MSVKQIIGLIIFLKLLLLSDISLGQLVEKSDTTKAKANNSFPKRISKNLKTLFKENQKSAQRKKQRIEAKELKRQAKEKIRQEMAAKLKKAEEEKIKKITELEAKKKAFEEALNEVNEELTAGASGKKVKNNSPKTISKKTKSSEKNINSKTNEKESLNKNEVLLKSKKESNSDKLSDSKSGKTKNFTREVNKEKSRKLKQEEKDKQRLEEKALAIQKKEELLRRAKELELKKKAFEEALKEVQSEIETEIKEREILRQQLAQKEVKKTLDVESQPVQEYGLQPVQEKVTKSENQTPVKVEMPSSIENSPKELNTKEGESLKSLSRILYKESIKNTEGIFNLAASSKFEEAPIAITDTNEILSFETDRNKSLSISMENGMTVSDNKFDINSILEEGLDTSQAEPKTGYTEIEEYKKPVRPDEKVVLSIPAIEKARLKAGSENLYFEFKEENQLLIKDSIQLQNPINEKSNVEAKALISAKAEKTFREKINMEAEKEREFYQLKSEAREKSLTEAKAEISVSAVEAAKAKLEAARLEYESSEKARIEAIREVERAQLQIAIASKYPLFNKLNNDIATLKKASEQLSNEYISQSAQAEYLYSEAANYISLEKVKKQIEGLETELRALKKRELIIGNRLELLKKEKELSEVKKEINILNLRIKEFSFKDSLKFNQDLDLNKLRIDSLINILNIERNDLASVIKNKENEYEDKQYQAQSINEAFKVLAEEKLQIEKDMKAKLEQENAAKKEIINSTSKNLPTVYEETVVEGNRSIKKITVINEGAQTVYQINTYNWGGVFYFKNNNAISKTLYEAEIKAIKVK